MCVCVFCAIGFSSYKSFFSCYFFFAAIFCKFQRQAAMKWWRTWIHILYLKTTHAHVVLNIVARGAFYRMVSYKYRMNAHRIEGKHSHVWINTKCDSLCENIQTFISKSFPCRRSARTQLQIAEKLNARRIKWRTFYFSILIIYGSGSETLHKVMCDDGNNSNSMCVCVCFTRHYVMYTNVFFMSFHNKILIYYAFFAITC